jgi:sporulation protein YlmC with PRC-barrel domain
MRSALATMLAATLWLASAPAFAQPSGAQSFVTVQPEGQWLIGRFVGQPVTNEAGERIGDINDVLFDKSGRIANVVIGTGGFLGIGEKSVALPFSALSITAGADGRRVVTLALSKQQLKAAPDFETTEKIVYFRAKERDSDTPPAGK